MNSAVRPFKYQFVSCNIKNRQKRYQTLNEFSETPEFHSLVIRNLFTPKNSLTGRKLKVIFCQDAVSVLYMIAVSINQILHRFQDGFKYEFRNLVCSVVKTHFIPWGKVTLSLCYIFVELLFPQNHSTDIMLVVINLFIYFHYARNTAFNC